MSHKEDEFCRIMVPAILVVFAWLFFRIPGRVRILFQFQFTNYENSLLPIFCAKRMVGTCLVRVYLLIHPRNEFFKIKIRLESVSDAKSGTDIY